ncbi:hypothetical protein [Lapidilactobacillus bayanensis]|uniref:hypothetical protein n=1 Tax=Lapidilactobacillus bayanensis TaxID=2485998 RepID=UPI000F79A801|nr:hypothetical protein [Lapidilactobacillus bayanensis]
MEKLNQEQMQVITNEVIKSLNREKHKQVLNEKDYRLRNTQILIREYPKLKAHAKSQPEKFVNDDEYEMLTGVKIKDHELAKYHVKTEHLMEYVDLILSAYKSWCLGGDENDKRRWWLLYDSYLSNNRLGLQEQTRKWNIDKSTVSRERTKAIQDLSVMLFGVAGLADFLKEWVA